MDNRPQPSLPPEPDAQWVSLWLDGRLSSEQQRRLLQALEQDAQLAQLARQWKQLRQQLRGLPRHELGEEFAQGVLKRIESLNQQPAETAHEQGGEQAAAGTDSPQARRSAGKPAAGRMPWEFWACVGTGVLAASLLLFWAWQAVPPEDDALVMDRVVVPEAASPAGTKDPDQLELEQFELPPEVVQDAELLNEQKWLILKHKTERKSSAAAKAPGGKQAPAGADAFSKERMSRAAGPRPQAPLAGGAGLGHLQSGRTHALQSLPTQIIPWERLPGRLQTTLAESQRAGRTTPSQIVVVQLGLAPEALRRGWLGLQLAAVQRNIAGPAKARRNVRSLEAQAPEAAATASPPQNDEPRFSAQALQQSSSGVLPKRQATAPARVIRLAVSQEQLPQLLEQLARSQEPRGPVQFLNFGFLVPRSKAPVETSGRFAGGGGVPALPQRQATPQPEHSQQLVLQSLPPANSPPARAKAPGGNAAPRQEESFQADRKQTPPSGQETVQLWLVLEVHPSQPQRNRLPLVAPPPQASRRAD